MYNHRLILDAKLKQAHITRNGEIIKSVACTPENVEALSKEVKTLQREESFRSAIVSKPGRASAYKGTK